MPCRGHWIGHLALQEEGRVSSLLQSRGLGSLPSAVGADQSWDHKHPIAGAVLEQSALDGPGDF